MALVPNREMVISIDDMLKYRDMAPTNIEMEIPGLTYPPELSNGKRAISSKFKGFTGDVQAILNSLDNENLNHHNKQLSTLLQTRVKSIKDLHTTAVEILESMLIFDKSIGLKMKTLSHVHKLTVLVDSLAYKSLGSLFIEECRKETIRIISMDHMMSLVQKNQEDINELDAYTKQRERDINMVVVLCHLYNQRNNSSQDPKLTHVQIVHVINSILKEFRNCLAKIKELGNPYEGEECSDEALFEKYYQISSLYAELILVFMERNSVEFKKDGTVFDEIFKAVKTDVIPNLFLEHLQYKASNLTLP